MAQGVEPAWTILHFDSFKPSWHHHLAVRIAGLAVVTTDDPARPMPPLLPVVGNLFEQERQGGTLTHTSARPSILRFRICC
jgi:hypothetical protein